jgi:hypothetical protein
MTYATILCIVLLAFSQKSKENQPKANGLEAWLAT